MAPNAISTVFLVAISLLFACGVSASNSCQTSTSSPCSSKGECVSFDNSGNGFCDCYSGRQGPQCENAVAGFSPRPVTEKLDFKTIFDFEAKEVVSFSIILPSVESDSSSGKSYGTTTFIKFGRSLPTACDYPQNSNWTISADSNNQTDVYTLQTSYQQLVACGLEDGGKKDNYQIYNHSLSISRRFKIVSNNGQFSLNRTSSVSYKFSILFPTKVSVSSSVQVIDNPYAEFLALTSASYDLFQDLWTVKFQSISNDPYYLKLNSSATLVSGDTASRVNASSASISSCNGRFSGYCNQEIQILAKGCDPLDFNVRFTFEISCQVGGSCQTTSPTSPTFTLISSSSCPIQKETPMISSEMNSYSDSELTTLLSQFGMSETLFFAVAFDSPAGIKNVTLKTVCIYKVGDSNNCQAIDKNVISFTDGITLESGTPVRSEFSLRGTDINSIIALNTNDFVSIVVQANLEIEYDGTFNKRSGNTQSSKFSSLVKVKREERRNTEAVVENLKSSAMKNSSSLLVIAIIALVTLFF